MLLSPIRHQPFTPQPQQRVGNGGETLAQEFSLVKEFVNLNPEQLKAGFLERLNRLIENPNLFNDDHFQQELARYLDHIMEHSNGLVNLDLEIYSAITSVSKSHSTILTMLLAAMEKRSIGSPIMPPA